MATEYCVVRTDNMFGTDVGAGLRSVRFYDSGDNFAEVENGVIAHLEALEEGQREVYKAKAATASDKMDECVLIAAPEVMYDERKRNLNEFVNEAGKAVRGYVLHNGDVFSLTAAGFDGSAPTVGAQVSVGTKGKLKAGTAGLGKCIAIEVAGRYTYYVILVEKTEA